MKTFAIYGAIVESDAERETIEDCTPGQFRSFISKLDEGEELQVQINSPGGSSFGGIAIANMIKQLSMNGHKTTAFVEGIAASIASVIMCACDKVVMGESSLVMIHNCWSVVQGDSETLRKEANNMDIINEAIISFYKSKFDLSADMLKELMNAETWFSGKEAAAFKFNCEVIPDESGFSIAAKLKDVDLSKFKHIPKALNMKKEEELKQASDEVKNEVAEEVAEETTTETVAEEPKDEWQETVKNVVEMTSVKEETKLEEPVAEDMVPKAEVEKRVSGMQSTMAKKMDAMKKDYEAKIADFEIQIKAKDEELAKCKAEATSLAQKLDTSAKELSEMTSALKEKQDALDALNARVNTPNENKDPYSLGGNAFYRVYRRTTPNK